MTEPIIIGDVVITFEVIFGSRYVVLRDGESVTIPEEDRLAVAKALLPDGFVIAKPASDEKIAEAIDLFYTAAYYHDDEGTECRRDELLAMIASRSHPPTPASDEEVDQALDALISNAHVLGREFSRDRSHEDVKVLEEEERELTWYVKSLIASRSRPVGE